MGKKYKKLSLFIILTIIAGSLTCSCQRNVLPEIFDSEDVNSDLTKIFDSYCHIYGINSGSYKLVDGSGNVLWNGCYGDMTENDCFAVASITKMFTATVVFNLTAEGILSFDDKIDMYLSDDIIDGIAVMDGHDYSHDITIRQLLSHTSGIANYFSESSDAYTSIRSTSYYKEDLSYTFEDALDMTRHLEAHFIPGQEGEAFYSDFNYQLLGKIIETVTGQSLNDNYNKYIYSPLRLEDTYLFTSGMSWDDIQLIDLPCGLYGRPLMEAGEGACGGIISTVNDVSTFIQGYMNGELFDVSYFTEIYRFTELDSPGCYYGLGLMMYDDDYELYGHTGSFGTAVFYCPDLDVYVIGTLNNCSTSQNLNLIDTLLARYGR